MSSLAYSKVRGSVAVALDCFGRTSPRLIGTGAALAGGFALGLALAAEHWGGLIPCSLCLLERWPYRAAILLGAMATIAPGRLVRPLLWLIVLALLANVALAIVHVGVEQHLWANPLSECAAPNFADPSLLDRLLQLSSRPPMPCDRAAYLIPFLPLSMAAMNALYAFTCAALILLFLVPAIRRGGQRMRPA